MCHFGLGLHSCSTPVIFIPLFFHSDGLPFRTWRLFKTEVELHMGTCCGLNSAGTAFVALASCVAGGVCLWSFPAQRLAIVRDELLHIFR